MTCPASRPARTLSAWTTSRWTCRRVRLDQRADVVQRGQAAVHADHHVRRGQPTRIYDLYIYDSTDDATTNYDHVLLVPSTAGKDGAAAVADLAQGDWADVKVTLIGSQAGQTAGFYVEAIEIAPDLSKFRVYFTSVARVNATYNALGPPARQLPETLATSRRLPRRTSRRSSASWTRTHASSRA